MDNNKKQLLESDDSDITSEVLEFAASFDKDLLPNKSTPEYERIYTDFMKWKEDNEAESFEEPVFMTYFHFLSKAKARSTLHSIHTKLEKVLMVKQNVDIRKYGRVRAFLGKKVIGYTFERPKIISHELAQQFMHEAPDIDYLLTKVILVVGLMGTCPKSELYSIKIGDVYDNEQDHVLRFTLRNTANHEYKHFNVDEQFYELVKKYIKLRPKHVTTNNFFIEYSKGACSNQNVNEHTFERISRVMALYLRLDSPKDFTGHNFRPTAAALLDDSGPSMMSIQHTGGWKSAGADGSYVGESSVSRTLIRKKIADVNCFGETSGLKMRQEPTVTTMPNKNQRNDIIGPKRARIDTSRNEENEDISNLSTTVNHSSRERTIHRSNETPLNTTGFNGISINNYGTINIFQREQK